MLKLFNCSNVVIDESVFSYLENEMEIGTIN